MRLIHSTLVLAALLFGAALLGHAQTGQKEKEIDQKKGFEKFNGKTLFEWSTDLKDKDVSVRVEAMAALKFYGPAARREVPVRGRRQARDSSRPWASTRSGFVKPSVYVP